MVDHDDMYSLICKSRFDKLDEKMDTILNQLSLGDGALTKRVALLEEAHRSAAKALWVAVSAFITAAVGAVLALFSGER